MSFRIVKVHVESGTPVRSIPVVYSDSNEASTDATTLNNRRQPHQPGYRFVVMELKEETLQIPV